MQKCDLYIIYIYIYIYIYIFLFFFLFYFIFFTNTSLFNATHCHRDGREVVMKKMSHCISSFR
jgi:hypothetical protein